MLKESNTVSLAAGRCFERGAGGEPPSNIVAMLL